MDSHHIGYMRQPPFLFFGPAGPISLKTVHWTVFQALDVPVPYSLIPLYTVSTMIFEFVYTQISLAIFNAFSAISGAISSVLA